MLRGKPSPFFQEPCFRVQNPISDDKPKPRTKITADFETQIAMTLAKSGYYGGNPEAVFNASIDMVMKTYHYEIYTREYEATYLELNKETQ